MPVTSSSFACLKKMFESRNEEREQQPVRKSPKRLQSFRVTTEREDEPAAETLNVRQRPRGTTKPAPIASAEIDGESIGSARETAAGSNTTDGRRLPLVQSFEEDDDVFLIVPVLGDNDSRSTQLSKCKGVKLALVDGSTSSSNDDFKKCTTKSVTTTTPVGSPLQETPPSKTGARSPPSNVGTAVNGESCTRGGGQRECTPSSNAPPPPQQKKEGRLCTEQMKNLKNSEGDTPLISELKLKSIENLNRIRADVLPPTTKRSNSNVYRARSIDALATVSPPSPLDVATSVGKSSEKNANDGEKVALEPVRARKPLPPPVPQKKKKKSSEAAEKEEDEEEGKETEEENRCRSLPLHLLTNSSQWNQTSGDVNSSLKLSKQTLYPMNSSRRQRPQLLSYEKTSGARLHFSDTDDGLSPSDSMKSEHSDASVDSGIHDLLPDENEIETSENSADLSTSGFTSDSTSGSTHLCVKEHRKNSTSSTGSRCNKTGNGCDETGKRSSVKESKESNEGELGRTSEAGSMKKEEEEKKKEAKEDDAIYGVVRKTSALRSTPSFNRTSSVDYTTAAKPPLGPSPLSRSMKGKRPENIVALSRKSSTYGENSRKTRTTEVLLAQEPGKNVDGRKSSVPCRNSNIMETIDEAFRFLDG